MKKYLLFIKLFFVIHYSTSQVSSNVSLAQKSEKNSYFTQHFKSKSSKLNDGFKQKKLKHVPLKDSFSAYKTKSAQLNDGFKVIPTKHAVLSDGFKNKPLKHAKLKDSFSSPVINHSKLSDHFMQNSGKSNMELDKGYFSSSSKKKNISEKDYFSGSGKAKDRKHFKGEKTKLSMHFGKNKTKQKQPKEFDNSFTMSGKSERKLRKEKDRKKHETGLFPKGVMPK